MVNNRNPHDLALHWSMHNQMDFILVLRLFKSSIDKAQVNKYTDKDINSDRSLILPSLRVKEARSDASHAHPTVCFDLDKPLNPNCAELLEGNSLL